VAAYTIGRASDANQNRRQGNLLQTMLGAPNENDQDTLDYAKCRSSFISFPGVQEMALVHSVERPSKSSIEWKFRQVDQTLEFLQSLAAMITRPKLSALVT